MLRDIRSIWNVDSAIERMLSIAAQAVRDSSDVCHALLGPKALPYRVEVIDIARSPILLERGESVYSPLPYASRALALSAVNGTLLALANAVKTYVDTHVTAAIRQQAGYNVRASLMIYIEPSQGVMPDNAHWRAWVRDLRAKRWIARTRVFGRNSERPVQIPTPLTLQTIRLLHLENHAPFFLAASRELERLRGIRAQARPLFELVRRFWAVPSSGNTGPSGADRTHGGVGHPQGIDSTAAPARTRPRRLSESSYCNTAPQRARRQRHTKTHERVGT